MRSYEKTVSTSDLNYKNTNLLGVYNFYKLLLKTNNYSFDNNKNVLIV